MHCFLTKCHATLASCSYCSDCPGRLHSPSESHQTLWSFCQAAHSWSVSPTLHPFYTRAALLSSQEPPHLQQGSRTLSKRHPVLSYPSCMLYPARWATIDASTNICSLPEGLQRQGGREGQSCLGNPVRKREKTERWRFCHGVLPWGSRPAAACSSPAELLTVSDGHPKAEGRRNQTEGVKYVSVHL